MNFQCTGYPLDMFAKDPSSQQSSASGQQPPISTGRRDVEKRWGDSSAYRRAAAYALGVIVMALVVVAVFAATGGANRGFATAVPVIFFVGGLGALGLGLSAYFRGQQWVGWEGAGWFLLVLMLPALVLPYTAW